MLKLRIIKYMTLFDFIKDIKKGKYNNQTRFRFDRFEGDIDEFFKGFHCNYATLNEKIEILGSDKE